MASAAIHLASNLRLLCDSADVAGLIPEQEAALHTFIYRVLAAYNGLQEKIPFERVDQIATKRLAKAVDDSLKSQQGPNPKTPIQCLIANLRTACDSEDRSGLTAQQEAALHAFAFKLLAEHSRLVERVPVEKVDQIASKRVQKAVTESKKK
jgi:hypothetical protein